MKKGLSLAFPLIFLLFVQLTLPAQVKEPVISFDFCGDSIAFNFNRSAITDLSAPLFEKKLTAYFDQFSQINFQSLIESLLAYKDQRHPDDWLFYQLIRKAAQQISPKSENYNRYTFVKWYLLAKTGYETILSEANGVVLFYIQCNENIYNIPARIKNGKQYVCLNYHDYKNINFDTDLFTEVPFVIPEALSDFSFKITQLPAFRSKDYTEKNIQFNYYDNNYHFKVKLNPQVQLLFTNYPVVDYSFYFNIPLSKETYLSLVPALKKSMKGLSIKNGVDYLMRFTRYAFLFQPDTERFGSEKRLTAEETLMYNGSDCEDRVSLFFYLVKEIYNLPMIVLSYPKHVTIAVQFDKPVGKTINYKGNRYTVCEPTPQKQDLSLGQMIPGLKDASYEVAYAYTPGN